MHVPFCPLPPDRAKRLLKNTFYGIAEPILKISPSLELELKQSGFDLSGRDYISIAFFSSIFMFVLTYFALFITTFRLIPIDKSLSMGFFVGIFFFAVTLFYLRAYPRLIVKRRTSDVERNLLFALRHMYVQITSGVPLFDAIVSVSQGNYGAVSGEFRSAVKKINSGSPMEKVLEEITTRNSSSYFRRSLWQMSNSIKTGSDLGGVLRNIIDYVSAEQKIMVRRYGSQLNPMTLAYMMIAVIIPSLGITFLMVLSSFSNVPVTESTFWVILVAIAVFQFMFLGIIKSKRPNLF